MFTVVLFQEIATATLTLSNHYPDQSAAMARAATFAGQLPHQAFRAGHSQVSSLTRPLGIQFPGHVTGGVVQYFWAKCRMCFPHLSFSKMLLNLGTVNPGPWHLTVCVWLWHMSPDSPWVTYPLVKGLHGQSSSSLLFFCTLLYI